MKTREIHQVDATGQVLGRLSTKIANLLRGKNKPGFTYNQDHGDEVIVSNADKIVVTGKKLETKKYWRHSGYPGNLKETKLSDKLQKSPEEVIRLAVYNMLPKNRLRKRWLKRLKFIKEHNEQ